MQLIVETLKMSLYPFHMNRLTRLAAPSHTDVELLHCVICTTYNGYLWNACTRLLPCVAVLMVHCVVMCVCVVPLLQTDSSSQKGKRFALVVSGTSLVSVHACATQRAVL